jgi:hypothetical protein
MEEWRQAEAEGNPVPTALPNAKAAKSAESPRAEEKHTVFGSFGSFGTEEKEPQGHETDERPDHHPPPAASDPAMSAAVDTEEFEERAALVQYGAAVPRDWAEGFARLDLARPANGFTERQWRQLIDDGGKFLDRWASAAAKAGWIATDVFGVHPLAPNANYSLSGLVPLIDGGEVVWLSTGHATIRTRRGSELSYLRREMLGSIPVWELFDGHPTTRRAYGTSTPAEGSRCPTKPLPSARVPRRQ